MRSGRVLSLFAFMPLILLGAPDARAEEERDPTGSSKALCPVCAVKEGTTAHETVHATRTYEGRTVGFCSEKCARDFDRDPARYAEAILETPADSTLRAPTFTRISAAPT